MITVELNCDLGEHEDAAGQELEHQLLPLVDSVNVACGGHAGSFARLTEIARLCREGRTAFGAHPSFPDRAGFGRRELQLPPETLRQSLTEQLHMAAAATHHAGIPLAHVKPHGALYNAAADQPMPAELLIVAIRQVIPSAALIALAGSRLVHQARQAGLVVREEFFADRGYTSDGRLLNRQHPGSVISCPLEIGDRVREWLQNRTVTTTDGHRLTIPAETLCIHSDTPKVLEIARHIRQILDSFSPKPR
ncbi:MAG: 5-oxoprolinase subunit PxpA [Planctomycetota bacterium]